MEYNIIDPLKNEKGIAGILTTVVASMVIVTTLSTVYVYLVNRAKHQGKIKQSREMIANLETVAKSFKHGYDTSLSGGVSAGGTCPSGTTSTQINNYSVCMSNNYSSAGGAQMDVNGTLLQVKVKYDRPYAMTPDPFEVRERVANLPLNKRLDYRWEVWTARIDEYFNRKTSGKLNRVAQYIPEFINSKPNYENVPGIPARAHAQAYRPVTAPLPDSAVDIRAADCTALAPGAANLDLQCEKCTDNGYDACFSVVVCPPGNISCTDGSTPGFLQVIKIMAAETFP